ncbi:hypothetical protein AB0I28_33750 [Phytomonospora sp. NPDC050363]|uniref:hypothetical protein n=1 Tax=Phytomonospora sp. NPDC050363 TaxID=3155642 RepID=UPI0033DC6124
MGETDPSKDTDVTNDDGHGDSNGSLLGGDWGSGSSYANTQGSDLIDSTPFASNVDGIGKAFKNIGDGSEVGGSIADVGIQITDMAANIGLLMVDPIGFLVNAGIGFLIDFIQPLEDMLGMVTGNPERMGAETEKWGRVRSALEPLGEQVKSVGASDLSNWQGEASAVAKQRLGEFGDAIAAVGGQIATLESVLELAKALAGVAQDVIKGIISAFVSNRIIAWMVAAATSGVSFGGSIAVFVAESLMSYSRAVLQVTSAMRRGSQIFQAIAKILEKAKIGVQALGNGFALIKALPGIIGKAETEAGSNTGMTNPQIADAMN